MESQTESPFLPYQSFIALGLFFSQIEMRVTQLCTFSEALKLQHDQLNHTLCDWIPRTTEALTSYVAIKVSQTNLATRVG